MGNQYPRQEYESGIVVAMTLALLQELNGRNATNPLSYIQAERLYRSRGNFPRLEEPRFLRCDLNVNTYYLRVANKVLEQFGWRHINWVESKFRRGETEKGTKDSGNKTTYSAQTLADIIRLCSFIYERPGVKSSSARYFLHVYDCEPKRYLAFRNRAWLKSLTLEGEQKLEIHKLNDEARSFKNTLGNIFDIKLDLTVYNQLITPLTTDLWPNYHCILTRIDDIKIKHGDKYFEISRNRFVHESERNAFKDIVGHIASNIHITEKDKASDDDIEINEEDQYDELTAGENENNEG